MSTTVGMVPVTRRRRPPSMRVIPCTWCHAPLVTVVAVIGGKVRRDALACSGCGRVAVHCECPRAS